MLADRRNVGEQRVGRHARSDGRKQGYKRIERNARGRVRRHAAAARSTVPALASRVEEEPAGVAFGGDRPEA